MKKTNVLLLIILAYPLVVLGQKKEAPSVDSLLEQKWSVEKKRHSMDYPMVHNGLVFPGLDIEYAIEAKTGKKLYFDNNEHQTRIRQLCKDSLVYYKSDFVAIVVNIYTGEIISKELQKGRASLSHSPSFIKDSVIYLVQDKKKLQAYNFYKERVLWEYELQPGIYDKFVVNDNQIYFGGREKLYCLNKYTGKLQWSKPLEIESNMILNYGILYVFTENKGLCAIDITNQSLNWNISKNYNQATKIKLKGDTLFRGSKFAVDLNGNLLWIQESKGGSFHADKYSTISNNYVFSYYPEGFSGYGTPFILDKRTGELLYHDWSDERFYDPRDEGQKEGGGTQIIHWADNVYNNLLIGATNGKVYCFEIRK